MSKVGTTQLIASTFIICFILGEVYITWSILRMINSPLGLEIGAGLFAAILIIWFILIGLFLVLSIHIYNRSGFEKGTVLELIMLFVLGICPILSVFWSTS